MNATKPTLPGFAKLPKTYEALCRMHLPRTLHDEIELDTVTEIIDLMAGHPLTGDQTDYFNNQKSSIARHQTKGIPVNLRSA